MCLAQGQGVGVGFCCPMKGHLVLICTKPRCGRRGPAAPPGASRGQRRALRLGGAAWPAQDPPPGANTKGRGEAAAEVGGGLVLACSGFRLLHRPPSGDVSPTAGWDPYAPPCSRASCGHGASRGAGFGIASGRVALMLPGQGAPVSCLALP